MAWEIAGFVLSIEIDVFVLLPVKVDDGFGDFNPVRGMLA